jgi:hypothetical protein
VKSLTKHARTPEKCWQNITRIRCGKVCYFPSR